MIVFFSDIMKVAREKWNICAMASRYYQHSHSITSSSSSLNITTIVILSGEEGLSSDYMGTYFMNLFSRIWNIDIRYVFNNAHFQRALWSARYPRR
jgi:hypothetical protein